jgi:ACS family glucarate transporter-like MFS transporter
MGLVMSAFFLTYAVLQIPAGALGQRWGTRRALSLYLLLWSVACGTFALAGGFWGLTCARLGQGAAQAGIFPCTTVSIGKWMPPTTRAMANGTLASFMSLGGRRRRGTDGTAVGTVRLAGHVRLLRIAGPVVGGGVLCRVS